MPNSKRTGGKSARARRRMKRAQLANPRSGIYGALTTVTINFYGRYDLKKTTWSTHWGMNSVSFGNSEIFSGPYKNLKFYREYLIRRAHFICTHEVIRTPKWKKTEHSEISTFSAATFIQDYDVAVKPNLVFGEQWDHVCAHPGVKTVVVVTGASKNTSHTWVPTEPNDANWRLTDNDGLCHLYMLAYKLDQNEEGVFDTYGHSVSTVVRVRMHVQLRGLDIQNDDSLSTHVVVLPSTSSSSQQQARDLAPSPTFKEDEYDFRPVSPVSCDTAESAVTTFLDVVEEEHPAEKSLDESFTELAI